MDLLYPRCGRIHKKSITASVIVSSSIARIMPCPLSENLQTSYTARPTAHR